MDSTCLTYDEFARLANGQEKAMRNDIIAAHRQIALLRKALLEIESGMSNPRDIARDALGMKSHPNICPFA